MRDDQRLITIKIPKPNRRWFQFSLATLLIVLTVACIWLAQSFPRTEVSARVNVAAPSRIFRQTQLHLIQSPYILSSTLNHTDIADLPLVKRQGNPFDWLQRNLKVRYPSGDGVMEISMAGKPSERSQLAQIVDAIVGVYVREFGQPDVGAQAQGITVVKAADER